MTDPFTTSIATALAAGATAALGDGVRALITRLGALVRERLRRSPPDDEVLTAVAGDPRDPDSVRRLAGVLDQHMRDDPEFAERLRALWTEITAAARSGDEITNLVHGEVHGSVIQARDVQGGITIHPPPKP
jgi:hypothetical protein